MANKFEVQVVALDKFTKTFRKLNDSASRAVRPLTNMQRQVGALSRELHLDKVAKGMGKVSQASLGVARNLGLATAPLEALFGLGLVGGIAGVAGAIVTLGARWGNLGFEINRTSQNIGVSTDDLQRYRGAATLAGISVEAMTGALDSLGTTLHSADQQGNQGPLAILEKLGIKIQRGKDGVVDTTAALIDLSRAIQRTSDPFTQRTIASAFGLEQALPLLRQGPEAIGRLAKEAERLGLVQGPKALQWAQDFGDALNRLKGSISGVANEWGAKFTPALTRGMNLLSEASAPSASKDATSTKSGFPFNAGPIAAGLAIASKVGGSLFGAPTDPGTRKVSGTVTYDTAGAASSDGRFVDPAVQAARDREAMAIKQREFNSEQDPSVKAALGREIARDQQRDAGGSPQQTVKVEVTMNNAPPGTQVQAKQGNSFVPTRISYSMPTTVTP